jgi:hypothetical protein
MTRMKGHSMTTDAPGFTGRILMMLQMGIVMTVWGCGDGASGPMAVERDPATAAFSVQLGKVAALDLARVEVVVTASDMVAVREELSIEGLEARGVIEVPSGSGRTFTLNGYGSAGELLYSGSTVADVVAGSRVRVEITMRPTTGGTDQMEGLSGSIPGLSFIQIRSVRSSNWDGDIEDDGLQVDMYFKDEGDDLIFWDRATVGAEVRIYLATEAYSEAKKSEIPIFRGSDYRLRTQSEDELLRVEYSDLLPRVSTDDFRESGDELRLDLVVEVTVFLADGTTFSARDTDSEPIPEDVLLAFGFR